MNVARPENAPSPRTERGTFQSESKKKQNIQKRTHRHYNGAKTQTHQTRNNVVIVVIITIIIITIQSTISKKEVTSLKFLFKYLIKNKFPLVK